MATIELTSIALLALLVAVLFGAQLEVYRDVRQLRDALGILDRPLAVDIGPVAGTQPSALGLPRALDTAASAVVLFISDRCETCRALAAGLGQPLPAGLWVVLEARSAASAADFLNAHGLTGSVPDGRIVVDVAGEIAARIGLNLTPIGFRLENGLLTGATTVPSSRYLASIVPERIPLRRAG